MKKILLMLLLSTLMFTLLCFPVLAEEISDEICDIVASLDVLPHDDYRSSDKLVTRAEMAYITARLSGVDIQTLSLPGEVFYSDVPAEHPFAVHINTMSRMGYIKGFSDGLFEPDYNATHSDAAFSIISVLGLHPEAEIKGGYPNGYLTLAAQHRLFNNTSGPYITQREMNMIIFRAVNIEGKMSLVIDGKRVYRGDFTILKDVLHLSKVDGIVVKNAVTSVDDSVPTGKDCVKIGNSLFKVGVSGAADWLGHRVTAYVKENDNDMPTITYIAPKYDSIIVYDEDISNKSNAHTIVSTENEKDVKYELSEYVEYIYNGKLEQGLSKSDVCIDNGFLELIDNNGDDLYDIVKITHYNNIFVDTVSIQNEFISGTYGKELKLDSVDYTIYNEGHIVGLADIKAHDVLSVAASKDSKYAVIHVVSDVVVGEVTEEYVTNNEYTINYDTYETASSYITAIKNKKVQAMRIGLAGSFYLDIRGRIAGYTNEIDEAPETYGYLFAVGTTPGIDSKVQFKIFTGDGDFQIYNAAKTVTVDGKRYKSPGNDMINEITLTDGTVRQLVRYRLNVNGDLMLLDTSKVKENYGETVINSLNVSQKGDKTSQVIWERTNNVQGAYFISDKTKLFIVPVGSIADDETAYTTAVGNSYFKYSNRYYLEGYDTDEDYIARVVLVLLNDAGSTDGGPIIVVDEIKSIYDPDASQDMKAIVTPDGSMFVAKNESILNDLSKGDVLEIAQDARQQIIAANVIFDASQRPIPTFSMGTTDAPHVYRALRRWTMMAVADRKSDIFDGGLLDANGDIDESTRFLYQCTKKPIVYDSARDIVYMGDITDIDEALYSRNPNGRVLVRQAYTSIEFVYIYK